MSLLHGEEDTRKITVGNGTVHLQRVKYCATHGWIDLFNCGGVSGWEKKHLDCGHRADSHDIQLKTSPKKAA